jgi:hypothetical protein
LAHVKTFAFLGGCPAIVVPDNLKSGVTKACQYEPTIHSSHAEIAQQYDVNIIPARVRNLKDKAKVKAVSCWCSDGVLEGMLLLKGERSVSFSHCVKSSSGFACEPTTQ